MDRIRVIPKSEGCTYEDIQYLLHIAHQSNKENGLIYASADQSVDKLIEKIGSGICLTAITENGLLVGTVTLSDKYIDYWYYRGNVLLLKLVGVHPDYRGKNIGSLLIEECIKIAKEKECKILVSDSAEKNFVMQHIFLKYGFKIVDCVKYKANNFVSAVYAKWIVDDCPIWVDEQLSERYANHRNKIEEKD